MAAIPVRASKRKLWVVAIGAILAVIVALAGIKAAQIVKMINAGKSFAPPPEGVTSAKVEAARWQASRSAVGTLVAVRAVTIASEVPGLVRQIGFDSGAFVRSGDILVKLDVSTEEAQLAAAEADAALAKATLGRTRRLREQSSATPADFDAAEARANQTAANVAMLKATIAKKTIRAPFDGRVAIRQVELGQVLASGTAIASLQSIHPIHADFWLPQQVLADLRVGMQSRLSTDVFPGRTWDGVITTVNPEVDPATRNVRVRATFPNTDGGLRPGMFGNVEVLSPDERPVLVIPATAVIYAPYGDSVYAIEQKDKSLLARQKFVRLGERRGDLVAVASGLEAGETIVSSGAFKLHNGSTLLLRNDLAPSAEIAPKPTEDK
ncbi:MAG: efflux RND transporter periplasmic adaptor subunit [Deltaproteobacteria bacterium]|nr:MAG: efflux RND transporter periplasmic adaptor subunit [Deltaproteobacteria bacterium]